MGSNHFPAVCVTQFPLEVRIPVGPHGVAGVAIARRVITELRREWETSHVLKMPPSAQLSSRALAAFGPVLRRRRFGPKGNSQVPLNTKR